MKRTPWFDGSQKPVRDGVYERQFTNGPHFARYANGLWYLSGTKFGYAKITTSVSIFQDIPWRGVMK